MKLIENGLEYKCSFWEAKYPWQKDPNELPDNRNAAIALFVTTEKRLMKDKENAQMYDEKMIDMVNRGAARKLTKLEINQYKGPVHYIIYYLASEFGPPLTNQIS